MTTYICTLYYLLQFHPLCCLRSQSPDCHSGGHPSPLPQRTAASEPIKRPSKHSVTIQTTPTFFAFRRGKGSTGGGGGGWGSTDVFSLAYLMVSYIFFFCTRNHLYVCSSRNTGHLYTYIHIHIYTHTYTYAYTCILPRTYTHAYIHIYIHILVNIHIYIPLPGSGVTFHILVCVSV